MRVAANQAACIGAGQCVFAAPDTFDQDDDGTVIVLQPEVLTDAAVARAREAVQICPSRALSIDAMDPAAN